MKKWFKSLIEPSSTKGPAPPITQDDFACSNSSNSSNSSRRACLKAKLKAGANTNLPIKITPPRAPNAKRSQRPYQCFPLVYALLQRDEAAAQLLLERGGADPNLAHEGSRLVLSPLHFAAAMGLTKAALALLAAGADPNARVQRSSSPEPGTDEGLAETPAPDGAAWGAADGDAALHLAARFGGNDIVEALYACATADVTLRNGGGRSALYLAVSRSVSHGSIASQQRLAMVKFMLGHARTRPDPAALFGAVEAHSPTMVKTLLESGYRVQDATDGSGNSLLLHTLLLGNGILSLRVFTTRAEIVDLLAKAGADVNEPISCYGAHSMLDYCSVRGWGNVAAALERNGARPAADLPSEPLAMRGLRQRSEAGPVASSRALQNSQPRPCSSAVSAPRPGFGAAPSPARPSQKRAGSSFLAFLGAFVELIFLAFLLYIVSIALVVLLAVLLVLYFFGITPLSLASVVWTCIAVIAAMVGAMFVWVVKHDPNAPSS